MITQNRLLRLLALAITVALGPIARGQEDNENPGELYGEVTDEKGMPVFGATVFLEGTTLGAQTDEDGSYRLAEVPPGTYNLVCSLLGYETQTRYNVLLKSRGNPAYNFQLRVSPQELNEVVVRRSQRISRPKETPLSTQTLSAVEIATYPGGNNDVVQVTQTLPGVSPSIGGFRNDLIIRGGAPNETVYYLDGMEVPNINHFSTQGSAGGPVGMVNVSFIDEVTLSTSAFGAQYDNPLSGVLQFTQRTGNPREFGANFRLSATEAALTFEGPLFKGADEVARTTFIASARRSYLQFLFELIGLPIRPDYWDYQYKLNHSIDDRNEISVLGLGSIDDFRVVSLEEFDPDQQSALDQAPFIIQRSNTMGITWKRRFKRGNGFMQTTLSNNRFSNEFIQYEDPENQSGELFRNDAVENETRLRHQSTLFLGPLRLAAGVNLQYSRYDTNTLDVRDGNQFTSDIDFYKYGWFAQLSQSFFGDRLDLSLGIRSDADSFTSRENLASTLSPRFSFSLALSDSWKLNGSTGRYFKIPPYTILGFRSNSGALLNRDVEYTRSDHFVLGLEKFFGPAASLSLEAFWKQYEDYPVSVQDGVSLANKGGGFEVLGNEDVQTVGRGRSYGMELQYQQRFTGSFYGIFAYTWFFSEFTGFDREVYIPSVWDSRHLVSFTGGYKLGRNWEISSRYRFAGETPFVPVDQQQTLQAYPEVVFDFTGLGQQRLATFSQLDVRIDKKWNFRGLSLNVFVEAQNILGQQIPSPPEYGLNRNETGQIVEPRSLVAIETDSSTIIPSLGIVLDL